MAGLKRRILIALTVLVVIVVALFLRRWRAGQLASFQGIPATAWALTLPPNFNPSATNLTPIAFQTMGANAVPPLRAMLKAREPWYSRLFVQQARSLPTGVRNYLAGKIKPGRSGMRRVAAARALGVVGTNATAAVPDLVAALSENDLRWAAAQALASIGGPAIAALTATTTNQDFKIRHAAVYGLGQAGTNALPATAMLIERACDPVQEIRASALYSLGQIGRRGVPIVLEAFSTYDPAHRTAAIEAIRAMETPPRQVFVTLLEFSTNASPQVRRNSLEALQTLRINHARVLGAYFHALEDPDPGVRASATRALGQANVWKTKPVLGEITLRLLGRSGSLDSNVHQALNDLLADPDASVRAAAQQTLASLQSPDAN